MVEKVLLKRNNLAAAMQHRHLHQAASGIQKLVDKWDKCLNEFGVTIC